MRPMLATVLTILCLAGLGHANPARAQAEDPSWAQVAGGSRGAAEAIGTYTNGCIAGAVPLPPDGEGFQVIRLSRNRNWGHPDLIAVLEDLGRAAASAGLPPILVGDLGQPRGGPITGHGSHETGLDADLWLRLDLPLLPVAARESLDPYYVTGEWTDFVPPGRLGQDQVALIRLATADPRVERVFLHPAIKRELCALDWSDRAWLGKIRPWVGHNEHLHIRIGCPPGSPACRPQATVPPGDGCGADLAAWFPMRPPEPSTAPPPPPPPLPAACYRVQVAP
jgi:penicillin-insensitive murein endopeptidase